MMLNVASIREEINCWIQVTRWLRKLAQKRQSLRQTHTLTAWPGGLAPAPGTTAYAVLSQDSQECCPGNQVPVVAITLQNHPTEQMMRATAIWNRVKTRGGGSFLGSYVHLYVYLCRDILFLKELFRVIWLFPLSSQFHKHVDTWQLSGHCWPLRGCNRGA